MTVQGRRDVASWRARRVGACIAPIALVFGMLWVFGWARAWLGLVPGYSLAFAIYWIVWGGLFPLATIGGDGMRASCRTTPRPATPVLAWYLAILALPAVGGFFYAFLPDLGQASVAVIVAVIVVAIVRAVLNGVAEELGWRAVYVRLFPDQPILGWLAPAIAFTLWHLAPLSAVPSSAGAAPLAGSLLIGLGYGWIAWRTGSIRWTTPFHVLTDTMGIGAAAFVLGLG